MSKLKITVVCCDTSPAKLSQFVEIELDSTLLDELVLDTIEQQLGANEAREMHNAAHHANHGPVTYLQQVKAGGFSIFVGAPDDLKERYFEAGSLVAFIDDQGPGHASKVGKNGVQRTLRVLKGHLPVPG